MKQNGRATIRILVEQNPKRPGTRGHAQFAELQAGMTVDAFLALEGQRPLLDERRGWAAAELRWCVQRGYIALDPAVAVQA